MNIITWNANRVNRYTQLWGDTVVRRWGWDVICLQEAGNPDPAWTQQHGKQWLPNQQRKQNIEPLTPRWYTYTPPGGPQVHIVHGEWSNHRKNHLVIITRMVAPWAADLSGEVGVRPTLGIAINLTWPNGTVRKVLLGCVHIVSSEKAEQEVYAVLKYVHEMRNHTGSNGWLLVGDFNCHQQQMINYVTSQKINYGPMTTAYPMFATHEKGGTLDYILASSDEVLHNPPPIVPPGAIPVALPPGRAFPGENWVTGSAKSDYILVFYTQDNGPTVQAV